MTRILVWTLGLLPICVFLVMAGSCHFERHRIDGRLQDPEGLVWGKGEGRLQVHIERAASGEKVRYGITVSAQQGEPVYGRELVVDWDIFGGGLVKATQVDDDPELEIVAWSIHDQPGSFVLDYAQGEPTEIPFEKAPAGVEKLVRHWHKYHVKRPFEMVLWAFAMFAYYLVYGLALGVSWWIDRRSARRMRQRSSADPA